MSLTHLTMQRGPFDSYTVFGFRKIKLFAQPCPQTLQMDISHRTCTLACTYQRVIELARLKTYPTTLLVLSGN